MVKNFTIRPLNTNDTEEWFCMRISLWPDSSEADMRADMESWRSNTKNATFVIERGNGRLGGFIEMGQRNYAEGCDASPVAYIEGWYVDEDLRGRGLGKALMMAGEDWARNQDLREIASDTWLDNETSIQAHFALGYRESVRLVHFVKKL
jgi:aminoglycoside 6'-N-acetyltransferase I